MTLGGKKNIFLAPGILGKNRGKGLKATLFSRSLNAKPPSSSTLGETVTSPRVTNHVHATSLPSNLNVTNASQMNQRTTNEEMEKELTSVPSTLSLDEEIDHDDFLQRSINNDAISKFLDQSSSQDALRIQEEGMKLTLNIKLL